MIDASATPLPSPAPRKKDSHKGDYGRAMIVGGSLGMAGAPALAGMACLRSGAGLTSVATPGCVQPTVAQFCADYMTHAVADEGEHFAAGSSAALLEMLSKTTAAAVGPGLGRAAHLTDLVAELYTSVGCPLVIDADALNALAERAEVLGEPGGPRVLTPHAGEFARLHDKPLESPGDDDCRREGAASLARRDSTGQTIVLLKGARTIVTDGERFALNKTGNPGMATGGSGDVLTGIVTALLCQGLSPFDAARLGAHVHGLAGDLAATKLGEISLTATDLINYLPEAWQAVLKT